VHFGISDVFQWFLGHLEPLNENPNDAILAALSILQNSRWRRRWPPSNGNYWNGHIFFVISPRNVLLCLHIYVLPPKEYDGMGFNRFL